MQSQPVVTEHRVGESAQPQVQAARQTQPAAAQGGPGYITLQPGETLSYISMLYGVSEKDLMAWNGIQSAQELRAGQRLAIRPPHNKHSAAASVPQTITPAQAEPAPSGIIVVASGQSLSGIAQSYGVTTAQLREWNGLTSDTIRAGQSLRVQPPPPAQASGSLGGAHSTASPMPGTPDANGMITVQSGQSLSGIAAKYKVSTANLRLWNKLKSDQLKIGQQLRVQAPIRVHTVKAGESLNGIAAKYKVSAKALMQKNSLTNADVLPVGKELIIP
jgi:LysM repeat protein